ncbi:CaiB/BaiF CoA transferase family protein [Paraburkholderia unamae]|uniref:Alpha-methylacyl-CoA racemase n=1 Tax=Paraburkholderia unamae TaxID=219649 RepID=A0ABX5KA94_9BURK|nr:CaiB/BaiF CoA-transferase family protein [Paraburkholderia unamae]PVX62710.1 alpha-methylacyl-CoA racemase [Paraburkholderia unamae]
MAGPLEGLRIIEMVGIGPCPFAAMMLADMGAEVIRIDRPPVPGAPNPYPMLGTRFDVMARGRRSLTLDLKHLDARDVMLHLCEKADAIIEGFRPGVMERLGIGPDDCQGRSPKLVYGRVTGWGQTGPLAQAAGHDINYLALTGLLHEMGPADVPPTPPLNLVGDFGGGGMMFAFGVLCALFEARRSGRGQIVDSAMLDGSNLLGAMIHGFLAHGSWRDGRETNIVAGGSHFYGTYACADGKYICVGAIEPHFYALLLERCGVTDDAFRDQMNEAHWPALKAKTVELFKTRTRDEWSALLAGTDACFAPVLDLHEAPRHEQNVARDNFIEVDGVIQPAPAPRFSRTQAGVHSGPATPGQHNREILEGWDVPAALIERVDGASPASRAA